MNTKLSLVIAMGALGAYSLAGTTLFTETFDDTLDSSGTSTVTGLLSRGWNIQNLSTPVGVTSWFGGQTSYIAQDQSAVTNLVNPGTNVGYIAANYNATGNNGTISDYLITPVLNLQNGFVLTFETLSDGFAPDALNVLMSTSGSSTNVANFTTTLLQINPSLTANGYPTGWTDYTIVLSGISGVKSGRVAFQYAVTGGGALGANSDYIGIDNVTYATPEPAPIAALGLGLLAIARRRRTR
jgi:hypothetical protein